MTRSGKKRHHEDQQTKQAGQRECCGEAYNSVRLENKILEWPNCKPGGPAKPFPHVDVLAITTYIRSGT